LYPGMTQPNYFQGNSFLTPYTYPVNMGFSNVMQYPNVQPYFFLSHCAKLQEKVEEMFNLVDANSDGKVTLAEMQDDTLDTDPRMAAIWNDIFSNLGGDDFQKKGVKSSSGDEYNEGFERALFTKNDANRDNSLDLIEFSNFVSDTFDLAIFFVQYDTDRDYHLDETEYTNAEVWNSLDMSIAETLIGSDDRKLSLVETMQLISIMDALAGNTKNIPDLCARNRINKIGYMG